MGRHNFGDIGAEANKTLSMQTYFPDVNVPLATTLRTQKAIRAAAAAKMAPLEDLGAQIKASPAANPAPRTVVTDPTTGRTEFSDVVANNASGESAASQEAINRAASQKAQGIKTYRIDTRSGNEVPLLGVDATDASAGPYDVIVQRGPKGETVLDTGARARPYRAKGVTR